ncbi:MAG TPA: sugar phosphate isomerase/epimerase [Clostridiales bacterium]|nr:sugar phosphate isomerase/epimerase [Clostridiales bacterium]
MALPIALQLYSVRDELQADFYGTLDKVKAMGYDGVEFFTLFDEKAEDVKAYLDKIGLIGISSHVSLANMQKDAQKVANDYKTIGVEYLAVPYLPEELRPGTDGFAPTIAEIERLGKFFKEQGIQLLYHNHDFEFVKVDGEYGLDILYNTVPAKYLQTELDVCWVNVGGEDPAKYIEKYSGRSPVVHLKDFVMQGRKKPKKLYELIGIESDGEKTDGAFAFRPVGHGVQDMPAILAASVNAGAKWVVVEQDRPDRNNTPMECAKKSIDYLKSIEW